MSIFFLYYHGLSNILKVKGADDNMTTDADAD